MGAERWSPGIGDPTFGGWLVVIAYAVAAILCLHASRLPEKPSQRIVVSTRGERKAWLTIAVFMAFLCINKQLDLQTLFTQTARDMAKAQGWYEVRRPVQLAFILALALSTILGSAIAAYSASLAQNRWVWGAAIGLFLLCGYIVVRASSFYRVDMVIGRTLFGAHYSSLFELLPILLIALAAWKSRPSVRA